MSKDRDVSRSDIERQTQEFLAKGGQIQQVPSKRRSRRSMKWIARRGHDYTPWRKC
jgi:hypothetical protein